MKRAIESIASRARTILIAASSLALGITIGITASVFAWTGPTAAPPSGNTAAPINVSATSQVKSGGFWASSVGSDNGFCIGSSCITAWPANNTSPSWASITGKPYPVNGQTWNWSGQGGQPAWLWGSNDGTNMYVWNPSNFSVNYANSANYANSTNYANSAGNANTVDGYSFNQWVTYGSQPTFWNIWVQSRNMWMSETARQDGGRFSVYGYNYYAVCPGGSVLVGGAFDGSNPWADCQWIN